MESIIGQIRSTLRRTADRMTGRHVPVLASRPESESLENRRLRTPPVDVFENEHEILIVADIPGAFPDNTRLHFDERTGLSIHVQLPGDWTDRPSWGDSFEGDWYRTFSLPDYADAYEACAAVRSGVLTIHVPKQPRPTPVMIPVTAS